MSTGATEQCQVMPSLGLGLGTETEAKKMLIELRRANSWREDTDKSWVNC